MWRHLHQRRLLLHCMLLPRVLLRWCESLIKLLWNPWLQRPKVETTTPVKMTGLRSLHVWMWSHPCLRRRNQDFPKHLDHQGGGRPPKAKAKAKAAASQKIRKKGQSSRKAKFERVKRFLSKASLDSASQNEEQPKPAKKRRSKATSSQDTPPSTETNKRKKPPHRLSPANAKKVKSPAKAKASTKKPTDAAVEAKKLEHKQRNARKSAAYRRAFKKAQDDGKSKEECATAGRQVS